MCIQGLIQDYQLVVLQEGESDMFQYFSTSLYAHFRILGRGNQPQGWEIPVLPTLQINHWYRKKYVVLQMQLTVA